MRREASQQNKNSIQRLALRMQTHVRETMANPDVHLTDSQRRVLAHVKDAADHVWRRSTDDALSVDTAYMLRAQLSEARAWAEQHLRDEQADRLNDAIATE